MIQAEFKLFWNAYPVHRARTRALNEFRKVTAPIETILKAVEAQKQTENWKKENGRWIPAPDNWLRDERWLDNVETGPIHDHGEAATSIFD